MEKSDQSKSPAVYSGEWASGTNRLISWIDPRAGMEILKKRTFLVALQIFLSCCS
jgi:hypothetical protein